MLLCVYVSVTLSTHSTMGLFDPETIPPTQRITRIRRNVGFSLKQLRSRRSSRYRLDGNTKVGHFKTRCKRACVLVQLISFTVCIAPLSLLILNKGCGSVPYALPRCIVIPTVQGIEGCCVTQPSSTASSFCAEGLHFILHYTDEVTHQVTFLCLI